jgi:hypothetical protein
VDRSAGSEVRFASVVIVMRIVGCPLVAGSSARQSVA